MLKEITVFIYGNVMSSDQKCNLSTKDRTESEYFPTIINILGRIVSNIVWNCLSSVLRREKRRIKPAIRIKWSERDSFMREEREGQINTAVTVDEGLHCGVCLHTLSWFRLASYITHPISVVWHKLKETYIILFCYKSVGKYYFNDNKFVLFWLHFVHHSLWHQV